MSRPTKAKPITPAGRLVMTNACSAIRHDVLSVAGTEVELKVHSGPLIVRRYLIIKPKKDTENPNAWIAVGPSGFDLEDGTPVWRGYELVIPVGEGNRLYARRGNADFGTMAVTILELGEA